MSSSSIYKVNINFEVSKAILGTCVVLEDEGIQVDGFARILLVEFRPFPLARSNVLRGNA